MQTFRQAYLILLCGLLFFGAIVFFDSESAYTQTEEDEIFQLTDERGEPVSSYPTGFTEIGGAVYFGISSELGGLWRTDGTAGGTIRVKDIQAEPYNFFKSGEFLYFVVYAGFDVEELWRSDGTAEGTILLLTTHDINPANLVSLNDMLYFFASTPSGDPALWQSDGTVAGTQMVTDAFGDELGSDYFRMVAGTEWLYIAGRGPGSDEFRLWRSDGTASGTKIVDGAPPPLLLEVVQDALYFLGENAELFDELWHYDPDEGAPQLLKNMVHGEGSLYVGDFAAVGDQFFFSAYDDVHGEELWKSDGTPAGTGLVKDIAPGPSNALVYELTPFNGQIYFRANDGELGDELWRSDGTEAGTVLVKDLRPGGWNAQPTDLTVVGDTLYFLVFGDNFNQQLWRSDGTSAGTVALKYIGSGAGLTAAGGRLYFYATGDLENDNTGYELWSSDGTAEGTQFIKDLDDNYNSPPFGSLMPVDNRLYFFRTAFDSPRSLWMSDGTTAPAVRINTQVTDVQEWVAADGTLFISGRDSAGGGLWKHEGGSDPLVLVQGYGASVPFNLLAKENVLFFDVENRSQPRGPIYDLWRSDGTAEGTFILVPALREGFPLVPQTVFQGNVYASQRNQIWVLDGTPNGIRRFVPRGIQGTIEFMQSTPNALYFVTSVLNAEMEITEQILWRSDGTAEGTQPLASEKTLLYIWPLQPFGKGNFFVADFIAPDATYMRSLWYDDGESDTVINLVEAAFYGYQTVGWPTVAGDQIFFTHNDGIHGTELWKSDGTKAGTALVKDIAPAELNNDTFLAYPGPLFAFGERLLFGANDGIHGRELWQSDGTTQGTVLVKDIYPGMAGSEPDDFVAGAGRVYFSANDRIHGRELWQSGGDAGSTLLVTDLYSGTASTRPASYLFNEDMLYMNNLLYFTADNGVDGQQLFALRPTGAPLALPPAEEPAQPLPHRIHLPIVSSSQ